MFRSKERPLREQLIEARAKIGEQLARLYLPADAGGAGGPPNFRDLIAELEGERRDIDRLPNTQERGRG